MSGERDHYFPEGGGGGRIKARRERVITAQESARMSTRSIAIVITRRSYFASYFRTRDFSTTPPARTHARTRPRLHKCLPRSFVSSRFLPRPGGAPKLGSEDRRYREDLRYNEIRMVCFFNRKDRVDPPSVGTIEEKSREREKRSAIRPPD